MQLGNLVGSRASRMTFAATVLTLYPDMFPGPLGLSLAGRALADGLWSLETVQIRDFATDKHKSVDDTPAGGGAGMVMRADVLARGVDDVLARASRRPDAGDDAARRAAYAGARPRACRRSRRDHPLRPVRGNRRAAVRRARQSSRCRSATMSCRAARWAALVLLDACIRLLPGVMGAASSGIEESFESGLLEYPQFTRPNEWEGRTIPEVLRSGDHARIAAWRKAMAEADTRLRRPDLWERHGDAQVRPPSGARRKK